MYINTGEPVKISDELKTTLEIGYNCFIDDVPETELIKVNGLKFFLHHLFRTEEKTPENEVINNHYLVEFDKLTNTISSFYFSDDEKERFKEYYKILQTYENEKLATFCLEDNGDLANSTLFKTLLKDDKEEHKDYLLCLTDMLVLALNKVRNFDRKDFVACFWHIGQLSEDGNTFKCHCHFLYDYHIKKTDALPKIKKQKEKEQDEIYDLKYRLERIAEEESKKRKIRIIVFLIFILLYIIFPNAFDFVLSFIQEVFEFLHEKIFNLIHKWF